MDKRRQMPLRIQHEIYDQLKVIAADDDRSINSYVVRLIKKDIEKKKKEGKFNG